jgi:hypothetical protein
MGIPVGPSTTFQASSDLKTEEYAAVLSTSEKGEIVIEYCRELVFNHLN